MSFPTDDTKVTSLESEAVIRKIIQVMHTSLDIDDIFQKIVDSLGQYLQADRCFISRYDPNTHHLCPPTREYCANSQIVSMLDADSGVWDALTECANKVCKNQPFPLDLNGLKSGLSPKARTSLEPFLAQAGLGCAVFYQEQCLAILFVHQVERSRSWTSEEKDMIEVVAAQAAVAIHQANLHEQLQARSQQLENSIQRQAMIADLNRWAIGGMPLNDLFIVAVQMVAEALDVQYSKIVERLPGGDGNLYFRAVAGFSPDLVGRRFDPGGEPHAAYTLDSLEPVVVEDIYTETRFQPSTLHLAYGLTSGVSAVIYGDQRPFGVLEADSTEKRLFTQEDVEFLQNVANLLGIVVERKEAEEIQRQSEEQLRNIFSHAAIGLSLTDAEGRYIQVNPEYCRMTGYSEEELLTMSFFNVIYPDDLHLHAEPIKQMLAGEIRGFSLEKRYQRKDGSVIWVRNSVSTVLDKTGKGLNVIRLSEDITPRIQAEQALLESNVRFRSIAESNMLGIFFWRPDGQIIECNLAFAEMLGYTPEEIQAGALNWKTLASKEQTDANLEVALELEANGIIKPKEKKYRHKDGHWVDVLFGAAFNPDLQDTGVAYVVNITERKQTEVALQEANSKFRRLVESNIVGVIFWHIDGRITSANDAFLRMLGFTQADVEAGLNWFAITPPEFQRQDYQILNGFDQNNSMVPFEKQYLRKDGDVVDVLVAGGLFEGSKTEGVAFILDISARKRAEKELMENRQKLEQSNRDLSQFAAVAAHDLQAPLRKVKTFLGMIQTKAEGTLNADSLELMGRVDRTVSDMQTLISDLLALSRVSEKEPVLMPVDMHRVMRSVLQNLDEPIREKGAEIRQGTMTTIAGDESQLTQLMQNLVENALKYQPPGQKPVVIVESDCRDDGYCQIRVQDNGIGFRQEYADRIFLPFERLHGKTSPYNGTGVGLAICKRIVERHGGTISVQSEPGQGTTFLIRLPVLKNSTDLAPVFQ